MGSLSEMAAVEAVALDGKPSAIRIAFDAWSKLATNGLPRADLFDSEILKSDLSRLINRVDVVGENPLNFAFRNHAALSTASGHYIDMSRRRVAESPSQMNRRSVCEEYWLCMTNRRPFYHEINQTIENNSRRYRRILLPVIDNNDEINAIYVAIRPLQVQ